MSRKFKDHILKLLVVSLLVSTAQLVPSDSANASQAKCMKNGQIITKSGKKFRCEKIANLFKIREINNSGSNKKKITTKSASSEFSSEKVLPFNDLKLLSLKSNFVSEVAFNLVKKELNVGVESSANLKHYIGPNTTLDNPNGTDSLKLASKLFSKYVNDPAIDIIYFNYDDLNWAANQYSSIRGTSKESFLGLQKCKKIFCSYGASSPIQNGRGFLELAQGGLDPIFTGVIEIHEYTHYVQSRICECSNLNAPKWWTEGQAMFFGTAGAAKDFSSYKKTIETQNLFNKDTIDLHLTFEVIKQELNFTSPEQSVPGESTAISYQAGQRFIEHLIAFAGVEKNLNLMKLLGEKYTFSNAFLETYGLPLNEAVDELLPFVVKSLNQ